MAFERNDTMLHKVAKNMILVFLILINGMIMLSCSQDKVKFENVEVEIKGNHCIGTFDIPYLFKVTFDADIDLPVLPEYRSIPVRKVSLTIGEIKRLISICSDSNSVDLFGQWDLSKQELMAIGYIFFPVCPGKRRNRSSIRSFRRIPLLCEGYTHGGISAMGYDGKPV